MAENRTLPRSFGHYLLTRSFGHDPLGETLRAGTVGGLRLAPFVLVRIFDGEAVDREALVPSMETAVEHLDEFRGQAAAKGTVLGIVDDVPYTGIDWVPGLTLDRILAGTPAGEAPFTPENSLLVGEKLLAGLEAGRAFLLPTGAPHGFLVPAFVTVSGDGETRLFGAGLGSGLLPSLASTSARRAFGPYLAPEVASSGRPSAAGDIYSAAAIVLAVATGRAPEPGGAADAVALAPLPEEARALLVRMLDVDPTRRGADPTATRRALSKVLYAGPQASTFTLAFAVNQRFFRTLDDDRRAISEEERIDAGAIAAAEERAEARNAARDEAQDEAWDGAQAETPAEAPDGPRFGAAAPPCAAPPAAPRKGLPLPAVIAALAVVAGGVSLFVKMAYRREPPAPAPAPVLPTAAGVLPAAAPVLPTAALASAPASTPAPIVVGKDDPAFQAALQQQLALEMKNVQEQIAREQRSASKRQQAELDRAAEEARKARAAEEAAAAARGRADTEEATRLAKEAAEARQREEAARRAAAEAAEAAVAPGASAAQAGGTVDAAEVEQAPTALRIVKPELTAAARQRRISGTVLARVLVNESGGVDAVEILRDTVPPVGLAETTKAALKRWEWKPATKNGRPVKTWIAVPVPFDLGSGL